MKLRLEGRAPLVSVHGFARAVRPSDDVIIDLSALEFATPLEVAAIALMANRCRAARIELPTDPDVRNYLRAMGLSAGLHASVSVDELDSTGVPISIGIPLQRFVHPDDWDDYANSAEAAEVREGLHDRLGSDGRADVLNILGELADNAGTHGESSDGYYVAGQYYSGKTSGMPEGMWLSVVDAGIGVRAHLSSQHSPRDDADAIRMALTRGITGVAERRGNGLADVRESAIRRGPGRVLIRSGRGAGVYVVASPTRQPTAWYRDAPSTVVGTWVLVLAGSR